MAAHLTSVEGTPTVKWTQKEPMEMLLFFQKTTGLNYIMSILLYIDIKSDQP